MGKWGFIANSVMPCASMKRRVSRFWYSGLLRIPAIETIGDALPVNLKTPPRSTGT